MLESLHNGFTVMNRKEPAVSSSLTAFLERFPAAPKEYIQLVENEATEIELQIPNGKYLRIWGPTDCIDQDNGYKISSQIQGAIPIGDNGGGEVIFYLRSKTGTDLYKAGYGDLDAEDAQMLAPSLTALLCDGVGADLI